MDQWKEKSIFLKKNKEILDAELWAIWKALEIALKETRNTKNIPVTVFCDLQKALKEIKRSLSCKENRFLRGVIYRTAEKLCKNGSLIVIYWAPSHVDLIQNEKANLAARLKAEKEGRQEERWSSLAYMRKNLMQTRFTELTRLHKKKIQKKKASHSGKYISWTKNNISSTLRNAPKKYVSRYHQLKVGNGAVETYLARIGKIETPQCW